MATMTGLPTTISPQGPMADPYYTIKGVAQRSQVVMNRHPVSPLEAETDLTFKSGRS